MNPNPSPDPRQVSVAVGQPVLQAPPQVAIGAPVIHGTQVQVGTPVIEPQRPVMVQVGRPVIHGAPAAVASGAPSPAGDHVVPLPANPGHHAPFVARAANVVMHGRRVGWKPHEIAAAVDHVRGQYDNGYGVA